MVETKVKKKAKLPKSPVTRTKPSIAPDNRNTRVLNLFKVRFAKNAGLSFAP